MGTTDEGYVHSTQKLEVSLLRLIILLLHIMSRPGATSTPAHEVPQQQRRFNFRPILFESTGAAAYTDGK